MDIITSALDNHSFGFVWVVIWSFTLLTAYIIFYILAKVGGVETNTKWRNMQTIIAEFESPKQLSAAEVGYLIDRRFKDDELKATIIEMARRKLIKLTKSDNEVVIQSIVANQTELKISDCEAAILGYVENPQESVVTWTSLCSHFSKIYGLKWDFEKEVISQLIKKGYLNEDAQKPSNSIRRFKTYITLALSFLIVLPMILWLTKPATDEFDKLDRNASSVLLWPVFLAAVLVIHVYVLLVWRQFVLSSGAPFYATDSLKDLWDDVVGFKLFLKTTEFDRQQTTPNLNDELLPYCVALGMPFDLALLTEDSETNT